MAVTPTGIYLQSPQNPPVQILPADTTTLKTLVATTTNGARITYINVHSTDTSNRDIVVYHTIGGTDYPITTIQIPLNSGNTNAIPAVNLLRSSQWLNLPTDACGNPYMDLAAGTALKVASTATITAAKAITFTTIGGYY